MQRVNFLQMYTAFTGIAATPTDINAITQDVNQPGVFDFSFYLYTQNSDATSNNTLFTITFSGTATLLAGVAVRQNGIGTTLLGSILGSPSTMSVLIGSTTPILARFEGRLIASAAGTLSMSVSRATSGTIDVLAASNSTLTRIA